MARSELIEQGKETVDVDELRRIKEFDIPRPPIMALGIKNVWKYATKNMSEKYALITQICLCPNPTQADEYHYDIVRYCSVSYCVFDTF